MSQKWIDLMARLGIDPSFTKGRKAEYYDVRSRPTYTGENPYEFWKQFMADPTRTPLYVAATLGSAKTWSKVTLNNWETDPDGACLTRLLQGFFETGDIAWDDPMFSTDAEAPAARSPADTRQALLQVKINGVHIMMKFCKAPGQDYFVLIDAMGKQGPFDGLNARTAPFKEIVMALLEDFQLPIPNSFPEGTEHVLIQAELAKCVTNSSHKDVCNAVMNYSESDEAGRRRILSTLKLYVFNACVHTPARGTRSEAVQKVSYHELFKLFNLIENLRHDHLKACPFLHLTEFTQELRLRIEELYRQNGPGANGEGFIVSLTYGQVEKKCKAKLVYSNTKAAAFELPNGILPVLSPATGGKPVGFVYAPFNEETGKCEQLIYTDMMTKPYHKRENGLIYLGSTKWRAADWFYESCEGAAKVPHVIGGVHRRHFVEVSAGGLSYSIKKSLLDTHVLSFLDMKKLANQQCYLLFKMNQLIRNFPDTVVFMGLFLQEDFDLNALIRSLQGSHDLSWKEKAFFQSYMLKDTPFDFAATRNFLKDSFSTCRGGVKPLPICTVHQWLGRCFREQLATKKQPRQTQAIDWQVDYGVPAASPKKQRAPAIPSSVRAPSLTALELAYTDTGGLVDSPEKFGRLMLTYGDEYNDKYEDCICYGQMLVDGKKLNPNQKRFVTTFYQGIKAEWLDMMRNDLNGFTSIINGTDDLVVEPPQAAVHLQPPPPPPQTVVEEDDVIVVIETPPTVERTEAGRGEPTMREQLLKAAEARLSAKQSATNVPESPSAMSPSHASRRQVSARIMFADILEDLHVGSGQSSLRSIAVEPKLRAEEATAGAGPASTGSAGAGPASTGSASITYKEAKLRQALAEAEKRRIEAELDAIQAELEIEKLRASLKSSKLKKQ